MFKVFKFLPHFQIIQMDHLVARILTAPGDDAIIALNNWG
jgi:hypothetical protein